MIDIFSLPLKAPKLYEEFIDKIRGFYKRLGYTEVFTPYIQDEPNLEKYIKPVEIDITYCGKKEKAYLHTSPERSMKALLKTYKSNIFQIAKVFRDEECGNLNNIEFTMLECYNVENANAINEISKLIFELFGENIKDILTKPKLTPFEKAFEEYLGVIFSEDEDILKNNLISFGYEFDDSDTWEELIDKMMVHMQPKLGKSQIEFLTDFPCKLGVLSTCKDGVSKRFELFIDGVEIVNGWVEETNYEKIKDIVENASNYKPIKDKEKLVKDYHNGFSYAGYSIGIERLFYFYATKMGVVG